MSNQTVLVYDWLGILMAVS